MREGFKRNYIIFTLPNIEDLDKRSQRMCSHIIDMKGHDVAKKRSIGVAYRIKMAQLMGKAFRMFIQIVPFGLPTPRNKAIYDKMKKEWNAKTSDENIDFMEQLEDPETYEKKLSKTEYIEALRKGAIDEEHFRHDMKRLGLNDKNINILYETNKKVEEVVEDDRPKVKTKIKVDRDGSIVYYPSFE